MKKLLALALVLVLALSCFLTARASASMVGGWTSASDTTVTDEARAALEKATEGLVGSKIEPISLLATQVVAGVNYCILCRITPVTLEPSSSYALVYVYANVDGTSRILDIDDIDIELPDEDDD